MPRRRKNFFRIRPRWEGRAAAERRLLINRLRLAFVKYYLHIDYNDSREVIRQLRLRVEYAARDFLPQNNVNGFFVRQFTDRFVRLIQDQRRSSNSADAFVRVAENEVDQYMDGSVTYFDNDEDDEF